MKRIIVVSVLLLSIALAVENLEVNPINIQPKDKSQLIIDASSPIDIQSKIEPDVITIPKLLNYQGKLTNLAGVPVADSTYSITFRLYNTSTGGSAFWTETQNVQTNQGIFNVLLGQNTPIESIPQSGNCYLEMQINPNPAMSPRIRLVSSAYAYLAKKSDTANYALSANINYVDSARVSTNTHKLQGKDTNALSNKFVDEGQTNAITNIMIVDNAVTSSKIQDGTIQLIDLAFTPATRPLTPPVSNTEIQDNAITSSKIQDNAVIGSKIQDNAIISSKIQDGTILRQDVASNFKAPYADTADYTRNVNIQYVDSARISVNAYNAYKLQGKDTLALDLRYVNEGQANSITNAMITGNAITTDKIQDGTITRNDVSPTFKAPLADTADYARVIPGAIDSARVSANAHKLQGKDTIALSAKFVDEGQTNSISSPMIIDGTITNTDISATAGISDTKLAGSGSLVSNLNADLLDGNHASAFALTGHTHAYIDSARVSANTHNAYKLQGKDTIALSNKFVDENQANSITSAMIVDGNVTMSKINQAGATTGQVLKWTGSSWQPRNDSIGGPPSGPAGGDLTGTYPNPTIANNAVNSEKILDNSIRGADIAKPCTLSYSSGTNPVIRVFQSGIAPAIWINKAGHSGVYVDSAARGFVAIRPTTSGLTVDSSLGNGIMIRKSADNAIYVNITNYDGLNVYRAGEDGVQIDSCTWYGFWARNAHTGLFVDRSRADGLTVYRSGDDGVEIDSCAWYGLWVQQAKSGIRTEQTNEDGLSVGKANWSGVWVERALWNGVEVGRAADNGVYADSVASDGVHINTAGATGVYIQNVQNYHGLHAVRVSRDGIRIDSAGQRGGYFRNYNNNYYALEAINNTGTGGAVKGLYVQGAGYATGGWSTKMGDKSGFAVISPNVEVMISGTGYLSNGVARIDLDPTIQNALSKEIPLKVIITPNAECNGICVTAKSTTGFTVKELLNGKSSVSFDWIAIGRIKNYEQTPDLQPPTSAQEEPGMSEPIRIRKLETKPMSIQRSQ